MALGGLILSIFMRNFGFRQSVYAERWEQPRLPCWEVNTWNSAFPRLGKHWYVLRSPLVVLWVQQGLFVRSSPAPGPAGAWDRAGNYLQGSQSSPCVAQCHGVVFASGKWSNVWGWLGCCFFFFCSLPFQSPLICNLPEGKNREGPSRMWCATLIRLSVKSLKAAHMMVKLKGIKLLLRLDLIICAAAAYWF